MLRTLEASDARFKKKKWLTESLFFFFVVCFLFFVFSFFRQVVLDDKEEKVYTLTAAQADEGEGTEHLKLRNVKGQGGVRV